MISFFSNELLKSDLSLLDTDSLAILSENIGGEHNGTPNSIVAALSQAGANAIINNFRDPNSEPNSYLELLHEYVRGGLNVKRSRSLHALIRLDRMSHHVAPFAHNYSRLISSVEVELIRNTLSAAFDKLSPEDKEAFVKNLKVMLPKEGQDLTGLAVTSGTLIVGNLSGFAAYTAMSSLLSTLTVGLLPFGAYTAASSVLSIALGPVGWLALGAYAVNKLGAPKRNDLMVKLLAIAMARQSVVALPKYLESRSLEITVGRLNQELAEREQESVARLNRLSPEMRRSIDKRRTGQHDHDTPASRAVREAKAALAEDDFG